MLMAIIIFGFSHQIMQLKHLANYIKDQVILKHFGVFVIFYRNILVKRFGGDQG
jgi:hypothetical protein